MKAYGKKHKKSKLGIHGHDKCGCEVCNTNGWKIFKSRERCIEYEEPLDTPVDYNEIENQVILDRYTYGDKEWFTATYVPLGICAEGVTPEHTLDKMSHAYMELIKTEV